MNLKWVLDKRLIVIPVILLLVSIFIIGYKYSTTSHIVDRSIELEGGNLITINTQTTPDPVEVEELLKDYDVSVRVLSGLASGITITTSNNPQEVLDVVRTKYNVESFSIESVGPVLSEIFWEQAQKALLIGFLLMSVTVFIFFRKLMPSLTVIAAAALGIIMTVAAMNVFGIELSLATLAALLLLIGYSVDTNILLTTHVLKTGQDFNTGVLSAIKTGLTTTATTIVALLAIFVAPTSQVLNSIALVLVIGLVFDVINTWITNVNLLRWIK